jgi:hypothetical protein
LIECLYQEYFKVESNEVKYQRSEQYCHARSLDFEIALREFGNKDPEGNLLAPAAFGCQYSSYKDSSSNSIVLSSHLSRVPLIWVNNKSKSVVFLRLAVKELSLCGFAWWGEEVHQGWEGGEGMRGRVESAIRSIACAATTGEPLQPHFLVRKIPIFLEIALVPHYAVYMGSSYAFLFLYSHLLDLPVVCQ